MAVGTYLAMALDILERAEAELDPIKRHGMVALAASYRRMAEQRGEHLDAPPKGPISW